MTTTLECTPRTLRTVALLVVALALPGGTTAADDATQQTFSTPAEAFRALVSAADKNDEVAMKAILGSGSEDIISSGDDVDDRASRKRYVAAARDKTRLETLESGAVISHIGADGWPFPIPVVKDGARWRFDTAAGRDELLNRRIGRNELAVIDVCREYVDAQREFAHRSAGRRVYAQRIVSSEGKHDGLYWDDPDGKDPSPLGPAVAEAAAGGYDAPKASGGPRAYYGYFYRVLTAQGASAPGGAKSWVVGDAMSGGFGLLAYPAQHGVSGVMTFIVGPQGIVYQKDLGATTAEAAKAISAFDPDDSWTPVRD